MCMLCNLENVSKRNSHFDGLKYACDMHVADDLVMRLGDINGHVGRHIDGFEEVHGGYGLGKRNLEGRMFLEFCLDNELCVSSKSLKREEKRNVTFRIGKKTEIYSMLIKKEHRLLIRNVKANVRVLFMDAMMCVGRTGRGE